MHEDGFHLLLVKHFEQSAQSLQSPLWRHYISRPLHSIAVVVDAEASTGSLNQSCQVRVPSAMVKGGADKLLNLMNKCVGVIKQFFCDGTPSTTRQSLE